MVDSIDKGTTRIGLDGGETNKVSLECGNEGEPSDTLCEVWTRDNT